MGAHLQALPPEESQNYLPDVWKRDLMSEQQAALRDHHARMAIAAEEATFRLRGFHAAAARPSVARRSSAVSRRAH